MKTVLACGTKPTSLGIIIKKFFERHNYLVVLFSRQSGLKNNFILLDLTEPSTFKNILHIKNINTIIFSQDSGTGFGNFDILTYKNIKEFINSKILGSIMFSRFLIGNLKSISENKIKLIWTCGHFDMKPKDYLLYHVTNSAMEAFVREINFHYSDYVEAYYLITPFMDQTTIGSIYNTHKQTKEKGENPQVLLPYLENIMRGKVNPGIVQIKNHHVADAYMRFFEELWETGK